MILNEVISEIYKQLKNTRPHRKNNRGSVVKLPPTLRWIKRGFLVIERTCLRFFIRGKITFMKSFFHPFSFSGRGEERGGGKQSSLLQNNEKKKVQLIFSTWNFVKLQERIPYTKAK